MTPRLHSDRQAAVPTPEDLAGMDAMVRRVLAIAGLEPRAGRAPLDPVSFGDERQICQTAKDRLEGLLRARRDLHGRVAARRPSGGSSASLAAALDSLAEEVASMAYSDSSIIRRAKAERATGPLVASVRVNVMLDACASSSTSIVAFLDALISAMERDGTVTVEAMAKTTPSTGKSTGAAGVEG